MKLRQRLASALAGVTLLAVGAISGAQSTLAAWSDREYASGGFAAKIILFPAISSCVLTPGVSGLSPSIKIVWNFPAGSGYSTPGNVLYYVASGGVLSGLTQVTPGSSLTTTGPSAGNYTTVFGSGLLSGLLGGSYLVGLRDTESGWTSTLTSYTAAMGLAGTNPTCTPNIQNP